MTTLATSPTYAPPNRDVQVIFTLTESGTNYIRVWVTAAPPGSELRGKLDASTQSRVDVHTGEGGADHPWRAKFDVGGRYTLVVQEYVRGASTYGGGYQGSPDGAPSETKVGSEATLSLFIGQRMTAQLGANGDTATLAVWVWNATIRETSLLTHGEATPALQADTPTPKTLAAIESAAVISALLALRNVAVTTALGVPGTILTNFIAKWNAHIADATVHEDADADNDIAVGLGSSVSTATLKDAFAEILLRIRYHYQNDATLGQVNFGRDSANYHNVSTKKNDNVNLPLLTGVGDADAYWALADIHRSYEAHRVSTAVHDAADSTNALDALPALLALASAFFAVLTSTSPTTPQTQSSGAVALIATAGFAETPL